MESSSSSAAAAHNPLVKFNYPRAPGRDHLLHRTIARSILPLRKHTEEEFRNFLNGESGVSEACNYIRGFEDKTVLGTRYYDLVLYLEILIRDLREGKRLDLLLILMELYIPIETLGKYFDSWVKNSELEMFNLILKQGHSLWELKGYIEKHIAHYGTIDVLDFFLALEDDEEKKNSGVRRKVFCHDIVYLACSYRNVDILSRVLVRGYPTNYPGKYTHSFPIYTTIGGDKNSLPILDYLIMYGVDINIRIPGKLTPLVYAFKCQNNECLTRLVDIGARIDNELDIPTIFNLHIYTRETLLELVRAGLDLQYRTSEGTPLEIIQKWKLNCTIAGEPQQNVMERYRVVEDIVLTLIAEQGK